ncbi:hypothetical protein CEXT_134521 [Caerostris extrusa]|uniref:Retrovirus-related Pol polyprotein from transposon TNT 1-94 n=1 Tax=Caerostris extrusa TaxID=172846 RepID=A0AAV4SAV2_CAEEX|nr:hypothetical protein CEXT_134521 [Caerostris extrusa]
MTLWDGIYKIRKSSYISSSPGFVVLCDGINIEACDSSSYLVWNQAHENQLTVHQTNLPSFLQTVGIQKA